MGADAAIIDALTKAEYARNPIDLSKYYEQSMSGALYLAKGMYEGIEKVFGETEEQKQKRIYDKKEKDREYNNISRNLKKNLNKTYLDLSTQESGGLESQMNQKIVDMVWDQSELLLNELDGIKNLPISSETRRASMDVMAKAKRLTDGAVKLRGSLLTIARLGGDTEGQSNINMEASIAKDGGKSMTVVNKLMQMNGDYDGIIPRVDENGNIWLDMTFEKGTGMKTEEGTNIVHRWEENIRADEVGNLLVYKDEKASTAILKEVATYSGAGGNRKNFKYDFLAANDAIGNNIIIGGDKENILDLIHRRFDGMEMSYVDAVKSHPVIRKATYESLGLTAPAVDADGDGDIEFIKTEDGRFLDEAGTLLSELDQDIILDKLINPKTETEKQVAKEELQMYYAMVGEKKYNELLSNLALKKKKKKKKIQEEQEDFPPEPPPEETDITPLMLDVSQFQQAKSRIE